MIKGIGTDIVAVKRVEKIYEKYGDAFARKILHTDEFLEYQKVQNPVKFLAKRFAAKEAFVKAIGTGFRGDINLPAISLTHDTYGKPSIIYSNKAWKFSNIQLSISDEKEYAVAFVVLEE